MLQLLLFNVTNGLIIGAFYVLMALGLSLILNLSNVINFAHGGFLVVGGYIAYTVTLSLLKNLSSLGIGLPTKIGRIEHWPLLRPRQHAWVLGAIASERYIVKRNGPTRRNGSACSIALIVHAARRS